MKTTIDYTNYKTNCYNEHRNLRVELFVTNPTQVLIQNSYNYFESCRCDFEIYSCYNIAITIFYFGLFLLSFEQSFLFS